MSIFSKILFFIIPINMLIVFTLTIIVRSILIKLGERESYFMVSLIADLILLKRISTKEGGKYNKIVLLAFYSFLLLILLVLLMIIFLWKSLNLKD